MTEKLLDHSLNLKTNFMRTRNYLLIICLFLTFCQRCIKELHELPPRPSLVVKLNGIEKDSIIVAPGEEIKIDIDFIANQGTIQELYIKDNAGVYLKGFPLTMDSTELQNKSQYSYSFRANDYLPEGGSHYQTYNFQVVCKDNNQPKQLINKTITILIADELKSYTVTLGAQANTEHGHFLKFSTGEVFTLEQARQMSMEELQEIELCYFYGEDDEVTSYYREQRLYPLLGTHNSSVSWGYLSNEFAALTPYKINTLDEAITAGGYAQNKFGFIQATITASPKYIEDYKYSTDLKRGVSLTEATHPTLEGIYIITLQKFTEWPNRDIYNSNFAVFRVKELVPGKAGYITLEVKASPEYLY